MKLSQQEQDRIISRSNENPKACPLLIDHECILYAARPVICRTHGYPIYIEQEGESLADFCPKNFRTLKSIPNDAFLNIKQLNTLLIAVNNHFLESIETDSPFPERIEISKALTLLNDVDEID